MPFTLQNVVPWGRTLDEYTAMFALSDADKTKRILGCGDGPASFNAEATQRGMRVISCDPIYQFTAAQIQARVDATYPVVLRELQQNQAQFVWSHFKTPEEVGAARLHAMQTFLQDYTSADAKQRYIHAELPALPFSSDQFELVLCSHFLFLYSTHFSAEFHVAAVLELCRVAQEVRIFPLLGLDTQPSPHVASVMAALHEAGHHAEQIRVPYEFQRGGNHMLRIRQVYR